MLEITDHGPVREIRLNRPPVNALNPDLVALLTEQLNTAGDAADAVIVSGRAGMFSAGLDIPALLPLDRAGISNPR